MNKKYDIKYYQNNKEQFKKYYQDNKEQKKEYYQNNKEYLQEQIICEFCQTPYQRKHKSDHQKTKKCKDAQYFYELD
jgi:hypothetical protein